MNSKMIGLIFVISVAVCAAAMLVIYLVRRRDKDPFLFEQQMAIGMFSIVVTSIVVLLGLVDEGAQSQMSEINKASGALGVWTVSIGGVIVVWLVVFLVTCRQFRIAGYSPSSSAISGLSAVDILRSHYTSLSYMHYNYWIESLDRIKSIIKQSELYFIDDLLPKVFYHGPADLSKPLQVSISTYFIFSEKKAIKLQRIRGKQRSRPDPIRIPPTKIYLTQTTSTVEGKASCLNFIASHKREKERDEIKLESVAEHAHGDWVEAPYADIDILLVAIYDQDSIKIGDYVYVDTAKYIDAESNEFAKVDLCVDSHKELSNFQAWQVAASIVNSERPVPLLFYKLHEASVRTKENKKENRKKIIKSLNGWPGLLDEAMKKELNFPAANGAGKPRESSDRVAFLTEVLSIIIPGRTTETFSDVLSDSRATDDDCIHCAFPSQKGVVLAAFTWNSHALN